MSQWARLRAVLAAVDAPQSVSAWMDAVVTKAAIAHPLRRESEQALRENSVHVLSFVNAHGFNMAAKQGDFAQALMASDTLLRDGAGMKILMKLLGRDPGANLNGTDLIPLIIDRFAEAGAPIAFMGTAEPWLSRAVETARDRGATVALRTDGFQTEQHYVDRLAQSPCRLIVLGMGMPKQERVASMIREHLDGPMLVVNGGAILDFLAGRFPRAPKWLRALGLEWVFRLVREPGRLFQRYIIGNSVFLWRAMRLKLGAA